MRVSKLEVKSGGQKVGSFVFWFSIFALVCGLYGCGFLWETKTFLTPEKPPYDEEIYAGYRLIKLEESNAADALVMIHLPEYELLSQSKSVIASMGEKKKAYKRWFNMVAFDEDKLTVQRKYFLLVDEKPKVLFVEPRAGLRFDSEVVLEGEVLDKPYADENARRIGILKRVLEDFRKDIDEVGSDNKSLATCGMLVNQAVEAVLVRLDSSPALAARLSDEDGLEFEHPGFDKGEIRMVVGGDVVVAKIRLGSIVKKFKVSFEREVEDVNNVGENIEHH